MDPISILLAISVLSIAGLFVFICSLRIGLFDMESAGARTILLPGEISRPDESSDTVVQRGAADHLGAFPHSRARRLRPLCGA